jgi:hypothetical protein
VLYSKQYIQQRHLKRFPYPPQIPLKPSQKKQEELTQEVEKYRQKLVEIQQIHLLAAQAVVPLAEAKQSEHHSAAEIASRQRIDEAKVGLAEGTAKHLLRDRQ